MDETNVSNDEQPVPEIQSKEDQEAARELAELIEKEQSSVDTRWLVPRQHTESEFIVEMMRDLVDSYSKSQVEQTRIAEMKASERHEKEMPLRMVQERNRHVTVVILLTMAGLLVAALVTLVAVGHGAEAKELLQALSLVLAGAGGFKLLAERKKGDEK